MPCLLQDLRGRLAESHDAENDENVPQGLLLGPTQLATSADLGLYDLRAAATVAAAALANFTPDRQPLQVRQTGEPGQTQGSTRKEAPAVGGKVDALKAGLLKPGELAPTVGHPSWEAERNTLQARLAASDARAVALEVRLHRKRLYL